MRGCSDLAGTVYSEKLDGPDKRALLTGQGSLTGIAFAKVASAAPAKSTTLGQGGQH